MAIKIIDKKFMLKVFKSSNVLGKKIILSIYWKGNVIVFETSWYSLTLLDSTKIG